MAVCKLNKDLLRSNTCGYSLPEITDVYLANYEDVTGTTLTANTEGGTEVATIAMAASDGSNLNGEGSNGNNGIAVSLTGNETESALPLAEAAVATVTGKAKD